MSLRLLALVAGTLALVFFWHSPFVVPFRLLPVLAHEAGHALAAWLTGGSVESIALRLDESGETRTLGGFRLLILNAGYLGTLAFGVAQLVLSGRKGARVTAAALGVGILVLAAFFVRPVFSFGFGWCLVAGLGYAAIGKLAPEAVARGAVRGTGLFCVLYAFRDIVDDVFRSRGGDATMLAELTWIPASAWGLGWIGASLLLLWFARRAILVG